MKNRALRRTIVGGAAALLGGGLLVARSLRRRDPSVDVHRVFATRFRLSHDALRRNLDHFVEIIDRDRGLEASAFGEHVALYARFLTMHHDSEDEVIFPTLLRHATGRRISDGAHLAQWTAEHREINELGHALGRAGERVRSEGRPALAEVRRLSVELRRLLDPHLRSEEELFTAERLKEIIPARELLAMERRAGRRAHDRLMMALFFAHSLNPDEQRMVFGTAPWVFRKLVLPLAGRRRFARFTPFAVASTVAV